MSIALPEDFRPHRWLRSAHLQSMLPSLPPRRWHAHWRARHVLRRAVHTLLDCEGLVTLKLATTRAAADRSPGQRVALLLHGWEGNSDSCYILSLSAVLLEHGFDVVRLNLRDHGGTQPLNRGLFHSCRLPEMQAAVRVLARQHAASRLYLAGFSLGGNFWLRVAAAGMPENVAGVAAISPVLDPERALAAMERGLPVYERYFISKWSKSLRHKQRNWPDDYDFARLLRYRSLRDMTRELVRRHTDYADMDSYLQGYAVTGRRLESLAVPTSILMAADDPIIPADDLPKLATASCLQLRCEPYGGHCGFIESLSGPSYADRFVLQAFRQG